MDIRGKTDTNVINETVKDKIVDDKVLDGKAVRDNFTIRKKVFAYMEEHRMLKAHDRVVVGVSGGADSVCLFLLLSEYAKRVPLSLAVVHVNHGIRREAGEDARFVEELCRERGISFFLVEENVRELASREGYSEEDAGRRVRYDAFFRTAERLGGARIAVAHNSNDNAETMLFHLFRGSGLQGLSGIAPVRGDIIRPILCLERREVEAYLRSVSAKWCRDITNEGDDYRRNRIRHHILPYAEESVASGAVEHMGRTAELLRETEDYLEIRTREAFAKCVEAISEKRSGNVPFPGGNRAEETARGMDAVCQQGKREAENRGCGFCEAAGEDMGGTGEPDVSRTMQMERCLNTAGRLRTGEPDVSRMLNVERNPADKGGFRIDIAYFNRNHTVLRKRILLKLLNGLSPTGKDISAVHVADTLELFEKEGNRSVSLPFGITARRQYGSVYLERMEGGLFSGKYSAAEGGGEKLPGGNAGRRQPAAGVASPENELPQRRAAKGDIEISGNTAGGGTWREQPLAVALGNEIFQAPSVYELGDWGKIEFTGIFIKKGQEVPIKRYTKWFDYDKIKECVVIRSRCQGDYLTIADKTGNKIRKSVKKYMVTEKIPRQIRDEIPLLAAGSHVLWLTGWRISEAFKVDGDTERILQVKLLGAEFCEDKETEEKDGGEH